jgi:hypothetical protein
MAAGKTFNGGALSVAWYAPPAASTASTAEAADVEGGNN